jgi:Cytochrome c7 and related cytochrome c
VKPRIAGVIFLLVLSASKAQAQSNAAAPAAPLPSAVPTVVSGPEQPIPFSHKAHAGTLQLPCEFCHIMSRSGETVAIPRATMCMQCHQTMDAGDPGAQKLAAYAMTGAPIPWVRVYQLPSFVRFSHKTHVLHGESCQDCHGPVAERVQLYRETDLSMAGCINCHRAKKANIDCDTCHTLQQ